MVLARRQSAYKVYYPEGWIEPQRTPRPPFPPAIRDESDQHTEQAHANRRHAVSPHEWLIARHRHRRCDDTEGQGLAPHARNLPPGTRQTRKPNGVNIAVGR